MRCNILRRSNLLRSSQFRLQLHRPTLQGRYTRARTLARVLGQFPRQDNRRSVRLLSPTTSNSGSLLVFPSFGSGYLVRSLNRYAVCHLLIVACSPMVRTAHGSIQPLPDHWVDSWPKLMFSMHFAIRSSPTRVRPGTVRREFVEIGDQPSVRIVDCIHSLKSDR
jgi:hypothetical protein